MLLTKPEVRRSIACVKTAFPRFGKWKHSNDGDSSHPGFALWGEFVPNPRARMSEHFFITFITFDIYGTAWNGCLSIGQHSYFWSSADAGDARLIDTNPCPTLEDAIAALKNKMARVFSALKGI